MADFGRGIKAGIIYGIILGILTAIIISVAWNTIAGSYIITGVASYDFATLFVFWLIAGIIGGIIGGIIFGLIYAAAYNSLPGATIITKGIVLALIF